MHGYILLCVVLSICIGKISCNEETFYMDDGCPKEGDDSKGQYQPKSFIAGVRCCSEDGTSCNTIGSCVENDKKSYDDAKQTCKDNGGRLCTKDELSSGICCLTGGNCDINLVWTSTPRGQCTDLYEGEYRFDDYALSCADYVASDCGLADNSNFDSYKDCCACGGGSTGGGSSESASDECKDNYIQCISYTDKSYCGKADNQDFNSYKDCCICGGGSTGGGSSESAADYCAVLFNHQHAFKVDEGHCKRMGLNKCFAKHKKQFKNDIINHIQVRSGCTLQVFRHGKYRGKNETITGSENDQKQEIIPAIKGQVSGYKCACK